MKVMLDKGCREIDAPSGRRYKAKDGLFDMEPSDAKAVVKLGGGHCTLSGFSSWRVGFRCVDCGFGSYFRPCSRCGGEAVREGKSFADCF